MTRELEAPGEMGAIYLKNRLIILCSSLLRGHIVLALILHLEHNRRLCCVLRVL